MFQQQARLKWLLNAFFFSMYYQCFPTNAVAVCKAKNAFDLVECYMLLNLYHIPVELRRFPVENITKIKHQES